MLIFMSRTSKEADGYDNHKMNGSFSFFYGLRFKLGEGWRKGMINMSCPSTRYAL